MLSAASPQLIKERLLKALDECPNDQLQTLAVILGSLGASESSIAHCLRCHDAYDKKANGRQSCTLPHPDHYDMDISKCGSQYEVKLECCGLTYTTHDYEDEPPNPFCFVGRHSDREWEVDDMYREDVEVAEEIGYDEGGRVVKSCAQNGCIV